MKEIRLTNGGVALVDDEDFERLSTRKWYGWTSKKKNSERKYGLSTTPRPPIYLHREVMRAPKGVLVDHIDGDGLNCQRSNMRLCGYEGNARNRRKASGTSRFKGVSWATHNSKWQVHISVHGKSIYVGVFEDEEEAGRAYDSAALMEFCEFSSLNFPDDCAKSIPVERVREAARCLR